MLGGLDHGLRLYAVGLTGEDVEVQADAATLAHAFESMARHVLGPRLTDMIGCSPIDEKYAHKAVGLMGRLTWTVERAAEYHAMPVESLSGEAE